MYFYYVTSRADRQPARQWRSRAPGPGHPPLSRRGGESRQRRRYTEDSGAPPAPPTGRPASAQHQPLPAPAEE